MATQLDLQEQEQLDELKAFWNKYGNLITWVLVLALGAYAAWTGWNYWQRNQGTKAAAMFDAGQPCGTEANMAKMLASEASWFAADTAIQTHGGFGFAEDYDIERKYRETRLYQVAPISTNLILSHVATHALGLPKSF